MNYLFAIISGILLAELANFILDYLPYLRKIDGKQIRTLKIKDIGEERIHNIETKHLPSIDKVFESVGFPFCKKCNTKVPWVTYLTGGRCTTCGSKSAVRFWVLFLGLPFGFVLLTALPIPGFRIADIFLLVTFYIIIFVMDVEHRVILLPVTIAGILFGFYFGISYHTLTSTVLGGIAGGGMMLIFYWFGIIYIRVIRKTSNPNMYEVALGFGDVTLSLILGLILGWPGIMGGLFLGILLGGVISGILLIVKFVTKKYAPNDLILPYAPFLVIGAFVIMIL